MVKQQIVRKITSARCVYINVAEKLISKQMLLSIVSVFLIGLIAHAYCFFSGVFSHDSLTAIYSGEEENELKIKAGRVFVPLYRMFFRGSISTTWLIGLLSLLFIGISVYFLVKLFDLDRSIPIILIAGICVTNITVISQSATYLHELDCNMFAMFMATCAVYLWNRYKFGFIYGSLLVAVSLGIYQSYISVSITLIMIVLILSLINKSELKKVLVSCGKSILMLIIGAVVYFLSVQIICNTSGVPLSTNDYNSIVNVMNFDLSLAKDMIFGTYTMCVSSVITNYSINDNLLYVLIIAILILCLLILLFYIIIKRKIGVIEKLFIVFLLFLLPYGMNISYILSKGIAHGLMRYAFNLLLVFAIVIVFNYSQNELKCFSSGLLKVITTTIIGIVIFSNIRIANDVYLKKDLEHKATFSLMTRVVSDVEKIDRYVYGETPIVFVGTFRFENLEGFENYYNIVGCEQSNAITVSKKSKYYESYFNYILNYEINTPDQETWEKVQNDKKIVNMSSYPKANYIQFVDDILVIKLSDSVK